VTRRERRDRGTWPRWIFYDWLSGCVAASGLGPVPMRSPALMGPMEFRLHGSDIWPRRVSRPRGRPRPELVRLVETAATWQATRLAWARITAKWFCSACLDAGRGGLAAIVARTHVPFFIARIVPEGEKAALRAEAIVIGQCVHEIVNGRGRRAQYSVAAIARFVGMTCFAQAILDHEVPDLARGIRTAIRLGRRHDAPALARDRTDWKVRADSVRTRREGDVVYLGWRGRERLALKAESEQDAAALLHLLTATTPAGPLGPSVRARSSRGTRRKT
jgi:hypothetical protein